MYLEMCPHVFGNVSPCIWKCVPMYLEMCPHVFENVSPMEATIKIVLYMSAVLKLDNCLLWCNPDLYRTISRYFVLVVLH
jgi:hypothetical protein